MQKEVIVGLEAGLHARPAALLVQEAKKFSSKILIRHHSQEVSALSIMGLMSLALSKGSKVTIVADGEDAEAAANALEEFLKSEEPVVR